MIQADGSRIPAAICLPFMDEIKDSQIDPAVLGRVQFAFSRKNLVLPLRIEDGKVVVAAACARSLHAVQDISRIFSMPAHTVLVPEDKIVECIQRNFERLSGTAQEAVEELTPEDVETISVWEEPRDLLDLADEAPVIKLVNSLLFQAVKERASDIHIEPYERELEVRFRKDGILSVAVKPPKAVQEAFVSRVKIMAGLDIAEKRLPQDGRIRLLVAGKDIDVRVSIVPTAYGERVVLRLLDRKKGGISLKQTGLDPEKEAGVEGLLSRTSGIILVTGPTGSGKTTTLYAAMNHLNSSERNIITIEDPIEYQIKGVGQIQVNSRIGLTFANGLRSILRQDPDVIMVGEIRDLETAEMAIQASLTGHLVLSTLHTENAPSAIVRLVDMGVQPFLLSSSVAGVIAQRLVRVICASCGKEYAPTPQERQFFQPKAPERLWRGAGCARCLGTGYSGQTGIFEMMTVGAEFRSLILRNADSSAIRELAIARGMTTMKDDGLRKAASGVTTLEEVLRVAG